MQKLVRYVVVLYKNPSQLRKVNEARKQQYVKRAAYQAQYIWGQVLIPNPTLPSCLGKTREVVPFVDKSSTSHHCLQITDYAWLHKMLQSKLQVQKIQPKLYTPLGMSGVMFAVAYENGGDLRFLVTRYYYYLCNKVACTWNDSICYIS